MTLFILTFSQGCTGSSYTGPCGGYDNDTNSYYIYLETSSGSEGDAAELTTSVSFDGKITL